MKFAKNTFWSFQKNVSYLLIAILLLAVGLNLYTYKESATSQPDNYNPLHAYSSDDFEYAYTQEYNAGNNTFGLYYELKEIAPNATVIVQENLMGNGDKSTKNLFDDFYNRLRGSAQAKIVRYGFVEPYDYYASRTTEAPTVDSGENWYLNSRRQRDGRPGLKWKIIHDNDPSTNKLLLFRSGKESITFIDCAILGKESVCE